MRKIKQNLSTIYLFLYNSLKMNNLHNIIVTKDIYFIYIDKKVSKKLINKIVVRCSKQGSNLIFFAQKSCCIGVFCTRFFGKNRKKSANFLQFFLSVYQQVRRKLKKKLLKRLDNF